MWVSPLRGCSRRGCASIVCQGLTPHYMPRQGSEGPPEKGGGKRVPGMSHLAGGQLLTCGSGEVPAAKMGSAAAAVVAAVGHLLLKRDTL